MRKQLEKWLQLAVGSSAIKPEEVLLGVECVMQKLISTEAERARLQIAAVIKSQQLGAFNITPAESKVLTNLHQEPNNVLTKYDVGQATAVMNKSM